MRSSSLTALAILLGSSAAHAQGFVTTPASASIWHDFALDPGDGTGTSCATAGTTWNGGCVWNVDNTDPAGTCTGQSVISNTPPLHSTCPTLAAAYAKVNVAARHGHGDQIRVLITNAINEPTLVINPTFGGKNATFPMVLGSYGIGTRWEFDLPPGQSGFSGTNTTIGPWAIQDVWFRYKHRDPTTTDFDPSKLWQNALGIQITSAFPFVPTAPYILVENCLQYYGNEWDIDGIVSLTVNGNVVWGNYAKPVVNGITPHTSGIHPIEVGTAVITNNILDANGYVPSALAASYPVTTSTTIGQPVTVTWVGSGSLPSDPLNYYKFFIEGSNVQFSPNGGDVLPSPLTYSPATNYYVRNMSDNGINSGFVPGNTFSLTTFRYGGGDIALKTTAGSFDAVMPGVDGNTMVHVGDEATGMGNAASFTASIGSTFTAALVGGQPTQIDITGVAAGTLIHNLDDLVGASGAGRTTITSQISGTPGGAGRYQLSQANSNSGAMSTRSVVLNVTQFDAGYGNLMVLNGGLNLAGAGIGGPATFTANSSGSTLLHVSGIVGTIGNGGIMTGTGVPANTQIVSGPDGNGDYTTNNATTLTNVTATVNTPIGICFSGVVCPTDNSQPGTYRLNFPDASYGYTIAPEHMNAGGFFAGQNPTITAINNVDHKTVTMSLQALTSTTVSAVFVGTPIVITGSPNAGTLSGHLMRNLDGFPDGFNHNIYTDQTTTMTFSNNTSARASNNGVQLRTGGVANDNALINNNTQFCGNSACTMTRNFFTESTNRIGGGAEGLEVLAAPSWLLSGNIYAHSQNNVVAWNPLNIQAGSNATISNNIFCDVVGGATIGGTGAASSTYIGNVGPGGVVDATHNGSSASPCSGIPGWVYDASVESYDAAFLSGPATLDHYMTTVRQQSRYNWHPEWTSDALNNYVFAGFGR